MRSVPAPIEVPILGNMPVDIEGTSLFGPFPDTHEPNWCTSPLSAITPNGAYQDVKFSFFPDLPSFGETAYDLLDCNSTNFDIIHQQHHSEEQMVVSTVTHQPSSIAISEPQELAPQSSSPEHTYLNLDCPNLVERKIPLLDNMETRSSTTGRYMYDNCNNNANQDLSHEGFQQWPKLTGLQKTYQTRGKALPCQQRTGSDFFGWNNIAPDKWTAEQVIGWLYSVARKYNIDHAIRGEAFRGTTGAQLCCMKLQDFAVLGQEDHVLIIYKEFCQVQKQGSQTYELALNSGTGSQSGNSSWMGMAEYSQWQNLESVSLDSQLPTPDTKPGIGEPIKRKRGRPRKHPRPDPSIPRLPKARGRKPGQRSKGHHLWEFLRDLLADSGKTHLIRWEDRQNGVFRIVDSKAVSDLWGARKKNNTMTYEKLSRAIRFCQNEAVGYFSRLPENASYPRRLCFKFGPKTSGWQINQV